MFGSEKEFIKKKQDNSEMEELKSLYIFILLKQINTKKEIV
jgi:hypothetical protein